MRIIAQGQIPNSFAYATAAALLGVMFLLMLLSMQKDALTFDELAHIPAGYSYLTQRDYRLNPEHPPLAKDIAALPLLFLNLNFPINNSNWIQDTEAPAWWVQFNLGTEFLYHTTNNPRQIIFWARFPMILLTLCLGAFLFFWARKLLGNGAALTALTLFSFSPNFIAHGRLVTTDVAATLGILVALYYWIEFLKQSVKTNIIKAGASLAFALLLKFSAVLLLPLFVVITLIYAFLHPQSARKIQTIATSIGSSLLAGIIAIFVILLVYQFHILNYPAERQLRDTLADLEPGGLTSYEQAVIWMTDKPILRPFAQFARGISMATQRGQFGNTVFLLGEIKAGGWWYYFPLIYLYKVPLALHVFALVGAMGIFLNVKKKLYQGFGRAMYNVVKDHFPMFVFGLFTIGYWAVAMTGNLNIGIRHLLPTFPLLYMLFAWGVKEFINHRQTPKFKHTITIALSLLFISYIGSSLSAFPHYISYYNELAGRTKNGYRIAVDSNYDWGQDFYRLLEFVKTNKIEKLHLDYFGGEDPAYWLGEKYLKYEPCRQELCQYPRGWIAVSMNQLMGGIAKPVAGFDQPTGYYSWLSQYTPVARAGNSIFIYHLE